MKIKYIKQIVLSIVFVFAVSFAFAQTKDPGDPPGGGPGGGDPPVGGGAPIGGGTVMLLVLGAAYGGKKLFSLVSESGETMEE